MMIRSIDNPFNDDDQTTDQFLYDGHDAARHYDPESGRWLNVEPIGYEAGDVNLYRYVGNAPCNVTDPTVNTASADPKN